MMTEKVVNFKSKFLQLKGEGKGLLLFLKSHHFKDNLITHACIADSRNSIGLEGRSENQERHPNTGRCSPPSLSSLPRDCWGAWPPHSDICTNLCCKSSLHDL